MVLLAGAAGCASGGPSASDPPATASTAPTPTSTAVAAPGGSAPGSTAPAGSTAPPDSTAIRRVDFTNITYQPDSCPNGGLVDPPPAGIPVHDGVWRREPYDSVGVEQDRIVYGDVTGDGRDEAAVTVMCSTGVASGTADSTWVFTDDPSAADGVRRLPFPALTPAQLEEVGVPGGYTKGAEPTIGDGVLTLAWTVFAADDPPVFPSRIVTTHLAWTGSDWRDAAPPTVRDRPKGQ